MTPPFPAPCRPLVLTFAGSDPSGGAGLQADLMAISSIGCHPLSVTTALTVQDTVGLVGIMPVAAFKIGLLGSIDNVVVIAGILADYPGIPLVLDPVLASGRGDELADEEMIAGLRDLLLPLTTILTPNTFEVRRLSAGDDDDQADDPSLGDCAQRLLLLGCEYVLVTGTHANTARVVNSLYGQPGGLLRSDTWDRLPGSYHGSGCTLASALAAHLARGWSVDESVCAAQEYTWQSLAAGFRPGMGQYIPDRFFHWRHCDGTPDG